jgi:outer membrane protein, multidrug efflux system
MLTSCVVLALTGCATSSRQTPPVIETPTTWKETTAVADEIVLPPDWWTLFEDAELNALEAQAVAANQDLQRAIARLTEARALARISGADVWPVINGSHGYSHNRPSENRVGVPVNQVGDYNDHYQGFDLSYEIDLWGRVRNANEAARADATAVAAELHVILLTLTADVARNYHQIRTLDAEIAVIQSTIALRRDALHLQETRHRAGLINETDASRARTELANVEAELHATRRSRAQIEHGLAVLCGQPPSGFAIAATSWKAVPPAIPAGLPSSLLQRRPDIAGAEAQVRAARARVNVAHAAFFPSVSLTGSAGFASSDLDNFLNSGSRTWSIGPSVHLPLFDGGASRANHEAAQARYEQSVAFYQAAVLTAFREVEDALSDLHALARQREAVNRALFAARDTAALANERYQLGLSNYLDVVDAERAGLEAERQAVLLRNESVAATIYLAKALGGGWTARQSCDQF